MTRLLKNEYKSLISQLQTNPNLGTSIGDGRYKIRLKNHSNNKGKSGGYRVITYTKIEETIVLVYIYSKSDMENISTEKIDTIIKSYKNS
ncbi:MAG: type II toxin-antitoxin system RelE/ParE family toxin [Sulfurimonas sp.]|nr:type II toxin-antitoxin system RelE/ParE family toxin [Sulfurimonas sp.]